MTGIMYRTRMKDKFFIPAVGPQILDVLVPLNKSRQYYDIFPGEYFLDKKKHRVIYLTHTHSLSLIILATGVASDSFFFHLIQHACIKFAILSVKRRPFDEHDKCC